MKTLFNTALLAAMLSPTQVLAEDRAYWDTQFSKTLSIACAETDEACKLRFSAAMTAALALMASKSDSFEGYLAGIRIDSKSLDGVSCLKTQRSVRGDLGRDPVSRSAALLLKELRDCR